MTKKQRIEYLVCTLASGFGGGLMYGLIGIIVGLTVPSSELPLGPALSLLAGVGGAVLISSTVSTLILSANFFKKRSLAFKVVAAILWPITFSVCFYAGFFMFIPYEIYNVIKIFTSNE